MSQKKEDLVVRVDWYTRLCLSSITVLLTVLVMVLWVEAVPNLPSARAAEPFLDSAAVRREQLDAQKVTNVKLDDLIELLKSGQVKVQMAEPASGGSHDKK